MGIYDFYFNWLKKSNFVDSFRQNFPAGISSLSVDGNSIIHECAQYVYAYGDKWKHKYGEEKGAILKSQRKLLISTMTDENLEKELRVAIGNKILELIAAVAPREYFFFAIDGTIPQAKISQTRSRRFKMAKGTKEIEEVESLVPIEIKSRFDSNSITPGTDFMIKLDQYLEDFFRRNINQLATNVFYSPHTIKGEGEHKIMDYFRSKIIKGNEYHVIYGLDTDLIMLSMGLNISNIILWRDDIREKLYIDNFKFELTQRMGNSPTAADDFILIMNMGGNDFLPGMPSLEDFDTSLNIVLDIYDKLYVLYKLTFTSRQDGRLTINWKNFHVFITNLKEHESYMLNFKLQKNYLKRESLDYATNDLNESGEPVPIPFNYEKFRNYWYNVEFTPRGNINTITKYVKPEFLNITVDLINEMVMNYLNGINWVAEYYFNGWKGANLKWYYKYYRSPLFLDIYNVLTTMLENKESLTTWIAPQDNKFLNVFEQLLSVLPPVSKYLLPRELQFLMEPNSPLSDYYPTDYLVDYELKDRDYKGIVILPFINPDRIRDIYRSYVRFGPERNNYIAYFEARKDKGWVRAAIQDKIICNDRQFKEEVSKAKRGVRKDRKLFQPQLTPQSGGPYGNAPDFNFKI